MIHKDECWLPDLVECENTAEWEEYENLLYSFFKSDFIDSRPFFRGKEVRIRKHPMTYEKEEAFWHITCRDYFNNGDRKPDLRRCERIRWVRAFIENYQCNKSQCIECNGLYVWSTVYSKTKQPRVKILLEEERYVVILEVREQYCLLITAYYLDKDHRLRKLLKEYEEAQKRQDNA